VGPAAHAHPLFFLPQEESLFFLPQALQNVRLVGPLASSRRVCTPGAVSPCTAKPGYTFCARRSAAGHRVRLLRPGKLNRRNETTVPSKVSSFGQPFNAGPGACSRSGVERRRSEATSLAGVIACSTPKAAGHALPPAGAEYACCDAAGTQREEREPGSGQVDRRHSEQHTAGFACR
jgi:hypothetical protein